MSDPSKRGAPWAAIWVGALVVAVAVAALVMYGRGRAPGSIQPNVHFDVQLPKGPPMPDAPRIPSGPVPQPK